MKDDGKEEEKEEKAESWEGENGDAKPGQEKKMGKHEEVIQLEIQQEQNDNREQKKEEEEGRDRKCKQGYGNKEDEFELGGEKEESLDD